MSNDILKNQYLTVANVGRYLNISQSKAYELAHRKDFPVCRFGGSIRLNAVQVGRSLKELGYANTRTKSGTIWLVVERTTDEMKSILPEPDISSPS